MPLPAFVLVLSSTLVSTATQLPASELVEAPHRHEWEVVEHIEKDREEVVLLDRADLPEYVRDEESFKTVLMRGAEMDRSNQLYYIDAMVAIDCQRSRSAIVAISKPNIGEDWTKDLNKPFGVFEPIDNDPKDRDTVTAVFQRACGPQWSYPTSQ